LHDYLAVQKDKDLNTGTTFVSVVSDGTTFVSVVSDVCAEGAEQSLTSQKNNALKTQNLTSSNILTINTVNRKYDFSRICYSTGLLDAPGGGKPDFREKK
jgi:hypothetical protein